MTECTYPIHEEDIWDLIDTSDDGERLCALRRHVDACEICAARVAEIERLHGELKEICRPQERAVPDRVGEYEIVATLGQGGMGIVYEAEQKSPMRRVALKIMRGPDPSDESAQRAFRREIAALARMRHPGLVTIFDAGRAADGRLFLVMELVRGHPIDEYAAKHELGTAQRVRLCVAVAEAVAHAHARGVLHRDLKPANVLVDAVGDVRVLDFGLARFLQSSEEASQSLLANPVGTLPYMSPEQLGAGGMEGELDERSDVYSCGVILYELLTGRLPHPRTSTLATAIRHLTESAPRHPTRLTPEIPRALGDVVLKAIAVERERRYASMLDFAEDLRRVLDGRGVLARPHVLRREVKRWCGRHRALLAVAGVAIFATAIAIGRDTTSFVDRMEMPRSVVSGGPDVGTIGVRWRRDFDFHGNGDAVVYVKGERLHVWSNGSAKSTPLSIPHEPASLQLPRYSPDCREIAFVAVRSVRRVDRDGWRREFVLCVWDPNREDVRELARDASRSRDLCWRRDGAALAWVNGDGTIRTIDLDGAELSRVRVEGVHKLGGYSNGDRWLLLTVIAEERSHVRVLRVGRSTTKALHVSSESAAATRDAIWGPGSRNVYYVSEGRRYDEIRSIGFDPYAGIASGASTLVVSHRGAAAHFPKLLKGARQLAYVVVEGDNQIHVAPADAIGRMRRLVPGRTPRLAPDASHVYFLSPIADGLYSIPTSGESAPRLVVDDALLKPSHFAVAPFELSPDGTRVIYSVAPTDDGRGAALVVVPSGGGSKTLVATTREAAFGRWSPDGRWLAYRDVDGLYVVAADGQTPSRRIAESHGGEEAPLWSPDGTSIAFFGYETQEDRRDFPALYHVTFPQGQQRRIDDAQRRTWKEGLQWHPSGEFLTFCDAAASDKPKIRCVFPDERPSEVLIDQPGHWDYVGRWAPDGKRFHFMSWTRAHPGSGHVYDYEERRVVAHEVETSPADWSRDGRVITWAMGQRANRFERLQLR